MWSAKCGARDLGFTSCTNSAQTGCRPDGPQDSLTISYLTIWDGQFNSLCQGDRVNVSSTVNSCLYGGIWTWRGLATQWTFVAPTSSCGGGPGGGDCGGPGTNSYIGFSNTSGFQDDQCSVPLTRPGVSPGGTSVMLDDWVLVSPSGTAVASTNSDASRQLRSCKDPSEAPRNIFVRGAGSKKLNFSDTGSRERSSILPMASAVSKSRLVCHSFWSICAANARNWGLTTLSR